MGVLGQEGGDNPPPPVVYPRAPFVTYDNPRQPMRDDQCAPNGHKGCWLKRKLPADIPLSFPNRPRNPLVARRSMGTEGGPRLGGKGCWLARLTAGWIPPPPSEGRMPRDLGKKDSGGPLAPSRWRESWDRNKQMISQHLNERFVKLIKRRKAVVDGEPQPINLFIYRASPALIQMVMGLRQGAG